jgi:hypothetical protein
MNRYLLLLFLFLVAVFVRYDQSAMGKFYEADGYYWNMMSRQPLAVKMGVTPNYLRVPPTGVREQFNLHSVLTTGMTPCQTYVYHILLLGVFALILYKIGGFILFSITIFAPVVTARTFIGWNDTDIYILIFVTLTTWAMYNKKHTEAGLWVFFLSFFWQGWTIIGAIIGMGVLFTGWKNALRYSIGIVFACILHFNQVLDIFELAASSSWPSGFLTTSEMTPPSFSKIQFLLDPISTWFLIAGLLIAAYNQKIFLYFTSCAFIFLVIHKGERFILPAIPIWAITGMVGLTSVKMIRKFSWVLILFCTVGMSTASLKLTDSERYLMIVDDTWELTCKYLKDNTPKNSVIYSWWSAGHIITDLANRQVCMDGGTQHMKRIFWVARSLVTSDIEETKTIALYLVHFGDVEINKKVDARENYAAILEYMNNQLATVKTPRPVYLLIYKEMLLNFQSYVKMAQWFVKYYPEHQLTDLRDTVYYKLFTGGLDNELYLEYSYSDGMNRINVWRINEHTD